MQNNNNLEKVSVVLFISASIELFSAICFYIIAFWGEYGLHSFTFYIVTCIECFFGSYFLLALFYLPLIFLIRFLFKKIQSIPNRIGIVAILVPVYSLIPSIFISRFFALILIVSLIQIIPVLIVILFLEKSFLPEKKYISITIILTILTSLFAFSVTSDISKKIDENERHKYITNFTPVIQYIEEYKDKNGSYPEEKDEQIKNMIIELKNDETIRDWEYKVKNNEFNLKIQDKYKDEYEYCSDTKNCDGIHIEGNWFFTAWD
mgnify:CR=1 FL=1